MITDFDEKLHAAVMAQISSPWMDRMIIRGKIRTEVRMKNADTGKAEIVIKWRATGDARYRPLDVLRIMIEPDTPALVM